MKILLIGANGQLGSDLRKVLNPEVLLKASQEDARTNKFVHATPTLLIPLTHADIEITDFNQAKENLERHRPDTVINTAAYNKVDACEDNVEKAFNVNAYATTNQRLWHFKIDRRILRKVYFKEVFYYTNMRLVWARRMQE